MLALRFDAAGGSSRRIFDRTPGATSRREVAFCKGATGARLQVFLEGHRFLLAGKLDRDCERPRPVCNSVARRPVVVPVKARSDIIGDSDVVPRRVGVASEDVDDPLFDSMHAPWSRRDRSTSKSKRVFELHLLGTHTCDLNDVWRAQSQRLCLRLRPLRGLRRDSLRLVGGSSGATMERACLAGADAKRERRLGWVV